MLHTLQGQMAEEDTTCLMRRYLVGALGVMLVELAVSERGPLLHNCTFTCWIAFSFVVHYMLLLLFFKI